MRHCQSNRACVNTSRAWPQSEPEEGKQLGEPGMCSSGGAALQHERQAVLRAPEPETMIGCFAVMTLRVKR